MAKVTKFNYSLDNRWLPKLDKMIERCTHPTKKQDAVLIHEGKEGTGKTTYAIANAYYVAHKTGRYFGAENVFFKIKDLIKAYQEQEAGIFVWDEPALEMLTRDRSKIVADLTRLLMTARKKRHFLIINIAHFNKFNDYLICDRPVGMIKVYEDKRKQIRAMYIPQKNLRKLWDEYKRSYKKSYHKYKAKGFRVHSFPDVLNPSYKYNVLSEFDIHLYESKKDEGINTIGREEKKDLLKELKRSHGKIAKWLKEEYGLTYKDYAKRINIPHTTFSDWVNIDIGSPFAKRLSESAEIRAK